MYKMKQEEGTKNAEYTMDGKVVKETEKESII